MVYRSSPHDRGLLRREIQQRSPFVSLEEEAYLNLQRTANLLLQGLTQLMKRAGVTPSQYNVLRILRGSHPEALTCGEIGERLVTPGPDVTRLLDRLEDRRWVERERDTADRRVVRSRITTEGMKLLRGLDEPVVDWLNERLGRIGPARLESLVELMEQIRTDPD